MNKKIQIIGAIRIVMVLLLIGFIISLQSGDKISDANIDDVEQAVIAQLDMSAVQKSTNINLKKFYGLNAADYEGVVFYSPVTNMDAEELLIVKLKDTSQAEAVETAINKRLETQMNTFEGYGVEQYALLENHVLDVRGNYILYVVHTDAAKADQVFRDSL